MNTEHPLSAADRAALVHEATTLPSYIKGKICEIKKTRKNGEVVTYYNLQYWHQGRNHTKYIPREALPRVREGIQNAQRLEKILERLSGIDVERAVTGKGQGGEGERPLKKKRRR